MIGIYLLIGAVTLLYVYLKWTFSYWDRKGFPSTGVSIPFGAMEAVAKGKRSFGLAIYDMYRSTKEPVIGLYLTLRPALLIRDAQLAYDVLTKDFASFHDRGVYVDEKNDPMSASLFQMEGASWKALRSTLTPAFTSGKLRAMFETSDAVGDKLIASMKAQLPESGSKELELKKLMSTYAIDIIATTIFGLEVDSFADPNNEFQAIGKKINRKNFEDIARGAARILFPGLEKFFVRIGWKQEATERMRELSHRTVDLREKNNIVRKDLLQLLLQLRNQGKVNADDNNWSAESTKNGIKSMSKDVIAGQLFLFYIAGYETTASTTSFTLYELTQNPEVMEKAKEDVRKALENHGGRLSYDAIADMKYLEACILETARKYPALPLLNRICTQDYPVPDSKLVIKKGTPIIISNYGLHRDPEYFPDPLSYQPERHLEESKNYNEAAFMPFGEGPRMCIGARMGKVNVKIAIAKVLSNFDLEIRKEKSEIEFGVNGVPLMPKSGVPVRLSLKK
ncbi:probable cytochrome P450 6d5 [Drosophila biarmipes]|uniref:probable cytochrome P450 6d5 n=1 Tax=Drosophila biarmipes TaxID=125945 RepID=UPI001CDACAD6|nr:probable cytochrome P450 6d5 [Drosophila biarmipes]